MLSITHSTWPFVPGLGVKGSRKGVEKRLIRPQLGPLTYICPFLPRLPGALAVSHPGSEAGDVIVALFSVPFGAFLLSAKAKLLIFVSSFGIRPGKGSPTDSAL